jgi:AmmeMemoRadiSam system protein B
LSLIFAENTNTKRSSQNEQQKFFAIIPHFTLQAKTIENFYTMLKETYKIKEREQLNIVLISPDHFNASKNNVDMLCKDTKKFCYQGSCISAKALPSTKTSGCLQKDTDEHGLGEQFRFIKKTFPEANVYPIVVKPRKFIEDTELINILSGYTFIGRTLIIASVDFSHYVDEDFAKIHDKKTFYTLNNTTTINEYKSLEVDCPSCLYITNTLAQQNNQYPKLFLRDSSSSIAGKNLGTGNTSREFIYYTGQKHQENGFTVAFFGDLIFDRQVAIALSGEQKTQEYFKQFFQNEDTKLSPTTYPHRKLFGIDFVGINLETPIVSDKKICQKSGKQVKFCSSNSILPYLKNIGFSLMNVANNHSLDG